MTTDSLTSGRSANSHRRRHIERLGHRHRRQQFHPRPPAVHDDHVASTSDSIDLASFGISRRLPAGPCPPAAGPSSRRRTPASLIRCGNTTLTSELRIGVRLTSARPATGGIRSRDRRSSWQVAFHERRRAGPPATRPGEPLVHAPRLPRCYRRLLPDDDDPRRRVLLRTMIGMRTACALGTGQVLRLSRARGDELDDRSPDGSAVRRPRRSRGADRRRDTGHAGLPARNRRVLHRERRLTGAGIGRARVGVRVAAVLHSDPAPVLRGAATMAYLRRWCSPRRGHRVGGSIFARIGFTLGDASPDSPTAAIVTLNALHSDMFFTVP